LIVEHTEVLGQEPHARDPRLGFPQLSRGELRERYPDGRGKVIARLFRSSRSSWIVFAMRLLPV
jgi:hypothetical protein